MRLASITLVCHRQGLGLLSLVLKKEGTTEWGIQSIISKVYFPQLWRLQVQG